MMTRRPWKPKPQPLVTVRGSTIDPKLRALVRTRAGNACECCAENLRGPWECHHRKLRSRGGQDSAANLLALCGHCHRRIHGHPSWAEDNGFMVRSYEDPKDVPVSIRCETARYLTVDGLYRIEAA